ncbi:MAG: dihydroorotase, partial [Flavobacterium sp.]|nr:dihydroorotase [Flavobacterium sp.]
MKVLIKEAHIIAPGSVYHNQILDLKIKNGVIEKLGNDLAMDDCSEVKIPNLKVSIGWFDSSVSFGEPGFEDRETIENGLQVA